MMNDELSSEAQDFLSLATSESDVSPNDADRKRIRKGVGVALAATSAAGVAASTGSASAAAGGAAFATGGLGLKVALVVALVATGGVGLLTLSHPESNPETEDVARATPSSRAQTSPQPATTPEPSAPSAAPLPSADPEAELVETPSPEMRTSEMRMEPRNSEAQPPGPAQGASARPSRPHVIPSPPPEAAPSTTSLSDELGLLRAAQRARVQGDVDEALRQLDEHRRRFPAGSLAAERDGTRVFVLCDASRTDEATRAQGAFLRDHSTSPLAHRVRSGCD